MESEDNLQPHRIPDSHHRKIELQSPADLTYLQANLVASAKEKLDLHFPLSAAQNGGAGHAQPATVISLDGVDSSASAIASANGSNGQTPAVAATVGAAQRQEQEDPLRARVRQLVDSFMARTWEGASKNITVNGMDAASFPLLTSTTTTTTTSTDINAHSTGPQEEREGINFVYEAYDTRLQAKVAGLYGELETLTAQVSRLRRTAPKQGADEYRNRLMAQLAEEEEQFQAEMAALRHKAASGSQEGALKLEPPLREGWHDDVKTMFEHATGELMALAGLAGSEGDIRSGQASLTETVGKVQRARNVALEFE
ncbi:hypothetical protein A1O1_03112 [Capronia coronata CBS 617.96]|uniref:Uncharacterized protein n=1 Tax=Capronia coronata CBS 617.96 TaxID=1182541 RepID=W9YYE3_9EURO|nr:uncharacterized protein A1O1_03112 [Capronia coronata CBS 617.96]EXJ94715.1 hypothetical protein A1O1_03112 [Capronia coronata CBS 617.96]